MESSCRGVVARRYIQRGSGRNVTQRLAETTDPTQAGRIRYNRRCLFSIVIPTMAGRRFNDITRQDSTLARLTAEAQQLMALGRAFHALLPAALAEHCRAVRIRDDELVVFADNGTVAARLRLIGPGLLPQLARQGFVARQLRVKVAINLPKPVKEKTLNISEAALDGMEQAASSVSNPLVSQALARLIAHHRK